VITFTKVSLPYGWLSNMAPYKVTDEGLEWRTTEHLFQALRFSDNEIREAIRSVASPMAAKMRAKANKDKMTVQPQCTQDLENMYKVLRLKVAQHPDLRVQLLATGNEVLIEDVTARPQGSGMFWGMAKMGESWQGKNMLGAIWMDLRENLKLEAK